MTTAAIITLTFFALTVINFIRDNNTPVIETKITTTYGKVYAEVLRNNEIVLKMAMVKAAENNTTLAEVLKG